MLPAKGADQLALSKLTRQSYAKARFDGGQFPHILGFEFDDPFAAMFGAL